LKILIIAIHEAAKHTVRAGGGIKFEDMQAQGDKNTNQIIQKISDFINHIDKATKDAQNYSKLSLSYAGQALNSKESASSYANNAANAVSAFKTVSENMDTLNEIRTNLTTMIKAYNTWSTNRYP
jgi:hypothetical protein